jgi:hypothetical protein
MPPFDKNFYLLESFLKENNNLLPPSGNSWFGIKKNSEETSDFILDDITIIEME